MLYILVILVPEDNPKFAPRIIEAISPETLRYLAEKGSFPVLTLLESSSTKDKAKEILLPHKKKIEEAAKEADRFQTVYAGILKALK